MRRVASDPETGIGAPFSGGFELANLILKIPFGISAELPLRHVETAALGLCVHVADVIGDRLFLRLPGRICGWPGSADVDDVASGMR